MSFTKSLLLGSAAVLATVVGAQAADLPSKKAAPATYVKICDAYGAGFFYIPGSDTCVKLGGYVRAEYQYVPGKDTILFANTATDGKVQQSGKNQAETGFEVRGRIDVDARTPTSMGVARTFVRLRAANTSGIRNVTINDRGTSKTDDKIIGYGQSDNSTTAITIESAMVQWAGFTFGVGPENYALMPAPIYAGTPWAGFPSGMKQIAYTATMGGGWSATIALEDSKDFGYQQVAFDRPQTAAYLVGNVRLDQAWGFAALHGMFGNNSRNNKDINGSDNTGQKTYAGWAIGATVSYKLPMIAAGDQIWVTANYTDGLLGAVLGGSGLNNLSTAAAHRIMSGVLRVDTNTVQTNAVAAAAVSSTTPATFDTVTAWNLGAIYTHYWAGNLRSNFSAGYVEISPPTSTKTDTWGKGKAWEVSGSLIYSPVKDLDIGLELQYANLKNTVQNPNDFFKAAGQPGLSVNNTSAKLRIERQF